MIDQQLLIFGAVGVLGLAIILFGFKVSHKSRKAVETIGAILFHVGFFGILYHKVSFNFFISLMAFVICAFILIDPLKIGNHVNQKIYRLIGFVTLFAGVAFMLDFISGFPVWLWAVPLIIYLAPYLIPQLKTKMMFVMSLAWLVVFSYVAIISYAIYGKYNPQTDMSLIQKFLPNLNVPNNNGKVFSERDLIYKQHDNDEGDAAIQNDTENDTTTPETNKTVNNPLAKVPTPIIRPTPQTAKIETPALQTKLSGPFLQSLQEADTKYMKLQKDYEDLKTDHQKIVDENKRLEQELEQLKKTDSKPIETL